MMMFDKVIINAFISSMLLLAANEASASGSEKSRKSEKLEKSGKIPKPACPPTMYWNSTECNMVQLRSTPISGPLNVPIKCTDYNFCVGNDLIVTHNVYSGPTFETKIRKFHATVKVVDIDADGTDIVMFNAAIKLYDGDSALVSDDTEIYWAGLCSRKEGHDPLYTHDVSLLVGTGMCRGVSGDVNLMMGDGGSPINRFVLNCV